MLWIQVQLYPYSAVCVSAYPCTVKFLPIMTLDQRPRSFRNNNHRLEVDGVFEKKKKRGRVGGHWLYASRLLWGSVGSTMNLELHMMFSVRTAVTYEQNRRENEACVNALILARCSSYSREAFLR